jgi:hypothetical protein
MSQPTTSIGFSPTIPAPPTGNQNTIPQSDNGAPLQKVSQYPQKATASLLGVVVPDGTSTTVDGTGMISAVVTPSKIQQETFVYATDTGTANAYAVALSPAPTLVAGSVVVFKATSANTGASTLAVNGGSAISIKKSATVALASGDIVAGQIVEVRYDGTNFQLASGAGGGSTTTFGGDLQTIDSTHQKVVGIDGIPIDTTVTWVDGMTFQYNASSGKLVPVFDRATRPVSSVPGKPSAGQLVLIYTAEATETFPANFAVPQSYGSLGVNPTATAVYQIFKNTANVGTVSISTSGVFTFATTSGAAFTLNAGDRFTMVAPGSQDATLADVSITLVGTRGSVSAAISAPPPVHTWRGAYSGGTAYNPYDEVSYLGSSYICIAASTGNLPTNASFWNLLASGGAAGTNGTNGTNGQMLYVDAQNQTQTYCADTSGAANTITIAPATAATSYVSGQRWSIKVANAVTGATVLNVSGLGNKNVKKWSSGTLAVFATGDISSGQMLDVEYDGTQFIAMSLGGGGGGGGSSFSCPALASFTWVNQGAATAIQTVSSGPILMTIPDNGAANWRGLFLTQPSTPYKVMTQIRGVSPSFANSQAIGLYFYDGTKLMGFEVLMQAGGAVPRVLKNGTVTGTGGTNAYIGLSTTSVQMISFLTSPMWVQLRNSGTTISFDYSFDGVNFINAYSEAVGTFITPTQIGFGGISVVANASYYVLNNLLNWATVGNATL